MRTPVNYLAVGGFFNGARLVTARKSRAASGVVSNGGATVILRQVVEKVIEKKKDRGCCFNAARLFDVCFRETELKIISITSKIISNSRVAERLL